jgi:hypothetical protein
LSSSLVPQSAGITVTITTADTVLSIPKVRRRPGSGRCFQEDRFRPASAPVGPVARGHSARVALAVMAIMASRRRRRRRTHNTSGLRVPPDSENRRRLAVVSVCGAQLA